MHGAAPPRLQLRKRTRQRRQGGQRQYRTLPGPKHFPQMPPHTKTGDIGRRADAMGQRQACRRLVALQHAGDGVVHLAAISVQLHVRGKQGAGAQCFGQNQLVPRTQAALAQKTPALHRLAADRETQRQLRTLQAVPPQ